MESVVKVHVRNRAGLTGQWPWAGKDKISVGGVYGVESSCRTRGAIRDLLPKQKEVSPSRRVLECGQRGRPEGFPGCIAPWPQGEAREGSQETHPPS